ncbi:hypothetical protein KBZ15_04380 [Cyanobium sp. BA20m-p-22]|jgi:hypothetical protein|uniref:hypothetical protein n=1 Tax=Cyanobium sp. BA20m-p-22 TaxID=2823704 RepID=UPI0019952ADD|nr:hypothetical protein [Cyanobium sp. BA20m-p-22]MCP9909153.1 hypothetical protein [Cyanobium sp. BA20m-p-22]MDA1204708.1 hypothetical protein [Cyanobacteriota bacterium]NQW40109.1 hypothetical protein [Cyanobacteria bacterium bin.275]
MTTSSTSAASKPQTRSEYVSTLPPWRRLLATFNWRPVYDIEQRTKQLRIESLESEKRLKLLQESNARIARFEQELFSSSSQAPSTGDSSPT